MVYMVRIISILYTVITLQMLEFSNPMQIKYISLPSHLLKTDFN